MAAPKIHPTQLLPAYAATGDVLTWNGSKWAPTPPAGGSAGIMLGYAEVNFTFPGSSNFQSDSVSMTATGCTLTTQTGNADLTLSSGSITYGTSGTTALYVVNAYIKIGLHTGCVSTDVHEFTLVDDILGRASVCVIGVTGAGSFRYASVTGQFAQTSATTNAPSFECKSTGGTTRQVSADLDLYITRYAMP